ncbi:MAG: GlsB/YeaQ/YmgE family stress response membrane protein [Myxococcaceae bacterium]
MGFCAWLVLGGFAGWLASIFTKTNAKMGLFANIITGVVGAAIGGFVFSLVGGHGVTGFNLYSLFVAVVGAVLLLTVVKAIFK